MTDTFDHPWLGGLFHDADITAIWSPDQQLKHLLTIEAAYTRALGSSGRTSPEAAAEIADKSQSFTPDLGSLRLGTARDGVPIPDLVRQLRTVIGDDANAIHKGATSQDILDTALSLTLRDVSTLLETRLATIQTALNDLNTRFGSKEIMGRTRMQAALPIPVAHRIQSWSAPLSRHADRLAGLRPQTERLQLAGPVGNLQTLGEQGEIIQKATAKSLGLALSPSSWHTTRDSVVDYANCLVLISGSLGKMGQDICLMAQQGIDEITFSSGGTSSAMPHKNNPVLGELLVTLARFNATQIAGMHHAMVHEQERSGAAWMLEWMILPQITKATARSLSAATELCESITRIGL